MFSWGCAPVFLEDLLIDTRALSEDFIIVVLLEKVGPTVFKAHPIAGIDAEELSLNPAGRLDGSMLDVRSTCVAGWCLEKVQHMLFVLGDSYLRSHRRRARRMYVAYVAAFRHVRRVCWWVGVGCTCALDWWWSVCVLSSSSSSLFVRLLLSLFPSLSLCLSLSLPPFVLLFAGFRSFFL